MWDKGGEARGVREMQSVFFFTDDLPAVVTLVCKFLYLLSSSHVYSNVPPYWADQYEFLVLLKSTLSGTRAHVVYQSALTAAPQYYNLAIPIPVPLFNNGLSITIVIIKNTFQKQIVCVFCRALVWFNGFSWCQCEFSGSCSCCLTGLLTTHAIHNSCGHGPPRIPQSLSFLHTFI